MKNQNNKFISILASLTIGLVLMGCDKPPTTIILPEKVKPAVPAETKAEAKTEAPAETKAEAKAEAPAEPKAEAKPTAPIEDDPNAFISKKGRFKITLPDGFPEFELTEGGDTEPSDIALSYLSEKHGRAGCMVMVNSSAGWAKAAPKSALDSVRDGNVNANPENTLEKESDFELNGFPGRRVFISQQSGMVAYFIRYDIILVKDRLY